jgi:protein phosphatase
MPRRRIIDVQTPSLLVMIGASGSGKSTLCDRSFPPTRIVSSDHCRALVSDDPADQSASGAAFSLAHRIIEERLRRGRFTAVDATNLERDARRCLLNLAALHHLPAVALVLDLPAADCLRHDRGRPLRQVGRRVIERQVALLRAALPGLRGEGFAAVHSIGSAAAARSALIRLRPLTCDRSSETGPFDVIGDVHGCARELTALLERLGYRRISARRPFRHPGGRRAVFVGDLVDRGPRIVEAARIAMDMCDAGSALAVAGNHDVDLAAGLARGPATGTGGTLKSIRQIGALPAAGRRSFIGRFRRFVAALPVHLVLDGGRLVVAHAGVKQMHIGRESDEIRRFALNGETTGEVDSFGLSIRVKWAAAYAGHALVVYGHTATSEPEWLNNTVNIDTGCVYGGRLTALRYPEKELIAVPAGRTYYRSARLPSRGVGIRAAASALPAPELTSS